MCPAGWIRTNIYWAAVCFASSRIEILCRNVLHFMDDDGELTYPLCRTDSPLFTFAGAGVRKVRLATCKNYRLQLDPMQERRGNLPTRTQGYC
mmetsp:Transcript_19969/g.47976  ORF Transcript_19969/g.47976 Transcript_19969/m.47976 type:complete len:93 (-) Transcript_19969:333-611(-)